MTSHTYATAFRTLVEAEVSAELAGDVQARRDINWRACRILNRWESRYPRDARTAKDNAHEYVKSFGI